MELVPILYDDDCRFCRTTLGLLLAWDRSRRLRPVAIQSEEGQRLLTEVAEDLRLASAHLVTPGGTVLSGSAGAEHLARLLPVGRAPASLFARFPAQTESTYRWIARNRGRLGRLGLRSRGPIPPVGD